MKQEGLEESERVTQLTFCGGDEGKVGAECVGAERGAAAEADFTEDDRKSEALLGMVVGGLHAVDVKEGEDSICVAVRINESLPEIFGMGIVQVRAADGVESTLKLGLTRPGFEEGNAA